jgi:hypothetical protein
MHVLPVFLLEQIEHHGRQGQEQQHPNADPLTLQLNGFADVGRKLTRSAIASLNSGGFMLPGCVQLETREGLDFVALRRSCALRRSVSAFLATPTAHAACPRSGMRRCSRQTAAWDLRRRSAGRYRGSLRPASGRSRSDRAALRRTTAWHLTWHRIFHQCRRPWRR